MKNAPLFAFFGTPRFAVRVLDALEANGLLPTLVVTSPDKPRGRGMVLSPCPAKEWAMERGIDVLSPITLKDAALVAELSNSEWDFFAVAAYAKLIPAPLLALPKYGAINVHPSLLPKFRGPSPVLSAILADERATGVSIMQMTEKMDAGPVLAQAKVELEEEAWPPKGSEFEDMLATVGGELLAETIELVMENKIPLEAQDESLATHTKKFTDSDAKIELQGDPREQLLKIRAFDKNPRAYFLTEDGTRVIITEAVVEDGKLRILKVIPEGRKEMSYEQFSSN